MRRSSALIAGLIAAALVAAAPASAKTLVGMSVCGAKGCVDRTDRIGPQSPDGGLMDVGAVSVADPGKAPFVRLKMHIGDRPGGQTFGVSTLVFLPKPGLVRNEEGVWLRLPAANAVQLRALARGVALLPAARLAPHRPRPVAPVATVYEVVPAPASAPVPTRARAAGGGAGGTPIVLVAGLGGGAAAAGAALVLLRRRRHAITETPATG
jgi:hypothetical protein